MEQESMKSIVLRDSQSPCYIPSPVELRRARERSYVARGLVAAAALFAIAAALAVAVVLL